MTVPFSRILFAGAAVCLVGGLLLMSCNDATPMTIGMEPIVADARNVGVAGRDSTESEPMRLETLRATALPTSPPTPEVAETTFVRDFEPPVLYGVDVVVIDDATKMRVSGAEVMALYSAARPNCVISPYTMECDGLYGSPKSGHPLGLDYEDRLRRLSRLFQTDDKGSVRIPSWNLEYLGARFGGKFAFARVDGWTNTLQLRPDTQIDVEVVDAFGKPVKGVQLHAVHHTVGERHMERVQSGLTRTNRDGRATLRNLDKFAVVDHEVTIWAGFPGLLLKDSYAELDLKQLPTSPIQLRVPQGRTLRVEVVDANGRPLLRPGKVELTPVNEPFIEDRPIVRKYRDGTDASASWAPTASMGEAELLGGTATFHHVDIDCEFTANLDSYGLRFWFEPTSEIAKPITPGPEVVRFQCVGLDRQIQCRLVGPNGQPLEDWEVVHSVRNFFVGECGSWGRTSVDGTFAVSERFPFDTTSRADELDVFARCGERTLWGTVDLLTAPMDRDEILDIHMREGDLLVQGTVRDDRGRPCPGVRVKLQTKSDDDRTVDPWGFRSASIAETHTDVQGRFVARDLKPQGVWFASIKGSGLVETRVVQFAPGETIDLRVARLGMVAGKIRTGSVAPNIACRVEVQVKPTVPLADWVETRFHPAISPDGTFAVEVPSGPARVRVFAINDHVVPLVDLVDVRAAPSDEPQDHRLNDIDVSSTLHALHLNVWGPQGDECDFLCSSLVNGEWYPVFAAESPSRKPIYVSTAPVDLAVYAGWSRFVFLSGVHSDTRVVLTPAIDVQINAAPAPSIPTEVGAVGLCLGYELQRGVFGLDADYLSDQHSSPLADGIHRIGIKGPGVLRAEWAIWSPQGELIKKIPASLNRFAVPSGVGASITFDMPPPDPAELERVLKSLRP